MINLTVIENRVQELTYAVKGLARQVEKNSETFSVENGDKLLARVELYIDSLHVVSVGDEIELVGASVDGALIFNSLIGMVVIPFPVVKEYIDAGILEKPDL